MIKKPKKVLAMALALSMLASAFVGTNAFAAGFEARDPIKTNLNTNFYTVDSNGVRNSVSNTKKEVAEEIKTYKSSDAAKSSVTGANFIVGEKYTVELTQNENQANNYEIKTAANLLVKDTDDKEGYIQGVTLTKDATVTKGAKYTAEFTAMTDSKCAVATTPKAGSMLLAVDVVADANTWTAKEYVVAADKKPEETHGTFVPVTEKFDGTEDAYFKFISKCDKPHYFKDGVSLKYYNTLDRDESLGTSITDSNVPKVEVVSLEKTDEGYDILYKVNKATLKTALSSNPNITSFSLAATAVESTTAKTITYSDSTKNDWDADASMPASAKPGELVTLTYKGTTAAGKVFSGIAATNGTESVPVAQMIDENKVTFVMPNENITIAPGFKVKVELSNDMQNPTEVSLVGETPVTLTEGEKTEILLKPSADHKFVNQLNEGGNLSKNGYTFEYKGITEEGYLKLDATIGSTATDQKVTAFSSLYGDFLVEVNPKEVIVPVCFDQALGTDGKANVVIKTFGTDGKLSTKKDGYIAIEYNNANLKLTKAYLGKNELDVNSVSSSEYTGYFSIFKDKATKDVFTVNYSYLNGAIDVNINPENAGSVKVTDGTNSINRQKADKYVYLTPQANDGYKFVNFAASYKITDDENEVEETVDVTLTQYSGDTYYFKMPAKPKTADGYGPSVTVEATFEKENAPIAIKNNTPEANKETNNGYISVNDSVALGETVNMQVLPNDGYVPNEIKVVAKKADKEVKPFDVKQNGSIHWGYSFDVPSDLDADSIEVSATFNQKPEVQDGWNKNADNTWSYIKDGKVVTGWKNDISGWEGQWFYFDANGIMQTGWKNDISGWEGQWFYFDVNTGVMATGWQTNIPGWGANWFYFDVNTGVMATGWQTNIPGWGANWFYFNTSTGTMLENQYTPDGYYVDANGCWVPNK